jgi:phage terminase large subunit GpA-like protein
MLDSAFAEISDISPSDWVEQNRVMTSDVSPIPGKFSYENSPYTRYIIDYLHQSCPATTIVVMKAAQIGFSVGVIEGGIGWIISQSPGNILFLVGHEDIVSDATEKVDRMIDNSGIRHLIKNVSNRARKTKSGDTDRQKSYAGGYMKIGTANHGILRQISMQYGFIDDFEKMKSADKSSGSTRKMIEQRFAAYASKQKIFYISTPELEETSNIYPVYLEGDQRKLHIKCPCCSELIVLEWECTNEKTGEPAGITWGYLDDGRLDTYSVGYVCQKGGGFFDDSEKTELLKTAVPITTAVPKNDKIISVHISALYSPHYMRRWHEYVQDYIDCTPIDGDRTSAQEEAYKTFVNLVLGLPYKPNIKSVSSKELMSNIRDYEPCIIPESLSIKDGNGRIILLTMGVDLNGTEDDARLDYEIVAFSESGATYSIDEGSIGTFRPKDKNSHNREHFTYQMAKHNSIWPLFHELLLKKFYRDTDGTPIQIMATSLDCGYMTNYAFTFSDSVIKSLQVYCVKGDYFDKKTSEFASIKSFKKSSERTNLYLVASNFTKDSLSRDMALKWNAGANIVQPLGFMNFPTPKEGKYSIDNYFSHFEAEHKIIDPKDNRYVWKKKAHGVQNHKFDCRLYALVARDILLDKMFDAKNLNVKNYVWNDFAAYMTSTKK